MYLRMFEGSDVSKDEEEDLVYLRILKASPEADLPPP